MRFRIASGLVNADGRQRALHYRSAWLGPLRPLRGSRFALRQPDAFGAGESRDFTTALHETSNGVLARLSSFALGYPLASLGPRKLGGYGGNFH